MSNSVRPGKRARLVASASDLMHRNGVEGVTLAQVADAADVPLGNVYYYFKTRDDLVRAVVDARLSEVEALLERLDRRSTPAARLTGLARSWADNAALAASSGCPVGQLSSDLAKRDDDLGACSGTLLAPIVTWAEQQFRALGHRQARAEALSFVAALQGAALIANAFHDPQVVRREVRRLERSLGQDAR